MLFYNVMTSAWLLHIQKAVNKRTMELQKDKAVIFFLIKKGIEDLL